MFRYLLVLYANVYGKIVTYVVVRVELILEINKTVIVASR